MNAAFTRTGQWKLTLGFFILLTSGLLSCSSTNRVTSADLSSAQENEHANTASTFVAQQRKRGKKANRLINEKSPYLLQHAYNPVDWYPWGEAAFARARKENKLIFLSIGYSTCYWCHVMEREVFENKELATLMNQYFVSIKVDREEHPEVDRVYMAALQVMMRGGGGWPMSMFLTPDLKPFHGETYIPPAHFRTLLEKIHEIWTSDPEKILDSSQRLTEIIKQTTAVQSSRVKLGKTILREGFERFQQTYDRDNGGFGIRPKFPRPVAFNFLLRFYARFGDRGALQMTLTTLRKMAEGGIRDHLGGGFHRYSVDPQWRVPHFEKMLYDQVQLVNSYLDAYQITGDEFYASIASEILNYILRNLTHPGGGFYSAEDAESAIDPKDPEAKEEGAYYLWAKQDIDRILGKGRAEIFEYAYGVEPAGNALEDPHRVFAGKNILYLAHTADDTAKRWNRSPAEVADLLADARTRLFVERQQRPRPYLDDKIILSWNGLAISAFARAAEVLGKPVYLRAAERGAQFVLEKLYNPKSKQLLRRYRAGEARFQAHLEDYAFITMGLLDLYEADLDIGWLKLAVELTERQNELFYDRQEGGFFDTSGSDKRLLLRTKETYDSAEPTGNSVAVLNLFRLSQMVNNPTWRKMAERTLALFGEQLERKPYAMPQMLVALDFQLDKPKQIILAGVRHRADTQRLLRMVYQRYIPNKVILLADGGTGQAFLSASIPFLQNVKMLDGKATAYICENYACRLPTSDPDMMAELLKGKYQRAGGALLSTPDP